MGNFIYTFIDSLNLVQIKAYEGMSLHVGKLIRLVIVTSVLNALINNNIVSVVISLFTAMLMLNAILRIQEVQSYKKALIQLNLNVLTKYQPWSSHSGYGSLHQIKGGFNLGKKLILDVYLTPVELNGRFVRILTKNTEQSYIKALMILACILENSRYKTSISLTPNDEILIEFEQPGFAENTLDKAENFFADLYGVYEALDQEKISLNLAWEIKITGNDEYQLRLKNELKNLTESLKRDDDKSCENSHNNEENMIPLGMSYFELEGTPYILNVLKIRQENFVRILTKTAHMKLEEHAVANDPQQQYSNEKEFFKVWGFSINR